MLTRLWTTLRQLVREPLTYARSADELSHRRDLDLTFSALHEIGDLPRGLTGPPRRLVYTELNRRGGTIWRAA